MSVVEERFGPTLPELARPLWRRLSTGRKAAALALVAVIVFGAATLVRGGRGSSLRYSGSAAPPFSFRYDGLRKVAPRPGELVRLEGLNKGSLVRSVAVEPVNLPARPNPLATTLPFAAGPSAQAASRRFPGFKLVAEGRTRLDIIDGKEAYMLGFTATGPGAPAPVGGLWVGKILLIPVPGKAPTKAVALELLERVTDPDVAAAVRDYPAGFLLNWPIRFWVQQRTSVDVPGELERSVKSFAFG